MFERISGKTPETGVNPDEAVALVQEPDDAAVGFIGGRSAVEQQLGGGIEIIDVTSQALGALLYEEGTDDLFNYVVIPRNSAVPGQYTDEIRTREKYQSKIRIQVTQGEDRDPDFVTRVGEGTLHMERIYPTTVPLRLIYKYDIDQTIEVEVIDLTADVSLGTFMTDRVANLKQDQVEQAAQRIGGMMIF